MKVWSIYVKMLTGWKWMGHRESLERAMTCAYWARAVIPSFPDISIALEDWE